MIDPRAQDLWLGPVHLDIRHCRENGWNAAQIEVLWCELRDASRRAYDSNHATGPVAGCRCVACNLAIPRDRLPADYLATRDRWGR